MPSLHALRSFRRRSALVGLLQIHHKIPREFANHPHVSTALPDGIHDADDNLMFMPTREGARRLRLREGRVVHDGGHAGYNLWVGRQLEAAHSAFDVLRLIRTLDNELHVPWR